MVTRCLLKFALVIARTRDVRKWRAEWAKLPETCPHGDCSPGVTCRDACGAYAAVQAKCIGRKA